MAVFVFLFILLSSGIYLGINSYIKNTQEIPAFGGEYTEALVGQPRFINPILSQTNDIDSDLCSLIFSGLMKFDNNGELQNDIAEKYEISEDKLTYTFYIKKDIKWHDGENLNVDDIIYTIKTIQNDNYYSPLIANWEGIRVEKVDDYTMNFILKNPYSPFLNNLTFGILPKHIWENTDANSFPLSDFNYQPIGSGPYEFENFKKDKSGRITSIELVANEEYYNQKPYITKIIFSFYQSEEEIISAFNRKDVKGVNYVSPADIDKIIDIENKNLFRLNIPRYYAIFFNQVNSKVLADKNVRTALAYATDKEKIINEILKGEGKEVNSPIPEQLIGHNPDIKKYEFNIDLANSTLEEAGWTDTDGDGFREKEDLKLEFTLVSTSWTDLANTAGVLKEMYEKIGVKVNIVIPEDVQEEYLKDRSYEAILFGEILNYDPDPFAFWHSSQKKDPGLNLALYDNSEVDKILEEARAETDYATKEEKYKSFQNIIVEDIPAIFLYSPNYIYLQNSSIKGVNLKNIVIPSNRFNDISSWYIKTKRVYK